MQNMPYSAGVSLLHHCKAENQIIINQQASSAESNFCILEFANPAIS